MQLESFELVRILILAAVAALFAFLWAPVLYRVLRRYGVGKSIRDGSKTPVFSNLHAKKAGTPTMGGILIWGTALVLAVVLHTVAQAFPDSFFAPFSFLSRSDTWLPLFALVASAVVGFVDDYYDARHMGSHGEGLRIRHRLLIYTAIAAIGAWWFYEKLGRDFIHVPFAGDFSIGWLYIPFFVFVIVATAFSVNETDGLDGLSGGTLMTAFGAFAIIAFAQGRYDLSVFCGVILGALLAFLWFNIHPATFFLGDTGSMSLGVTLGVVAMLTNAALFLPIIGLVFVIESLSVILQIAFRRCCKRKLFRSSPLHHHLEAIGWPEPKIVMRLWLVSIIASALGVSLALLDALV